MTSHGLEGYTLLLGFHPLGNHIKLQAVRDRDHRIDDRPVAAVGIDIADEGLIDLELINRQPL